MLIKSSQQYSRNAVISLMLLPCLSLQCHASWLLVKADVTAVSLEYKPVSTSRLLICCQIGLKIQHVVRTSDAALPSLPVLAEPSVSLMSPLRDLLLPCTLSAGVSRPSSNRSVSAEMPEASFCCWPAASPAGVCWTPLCLSASLASCSDCGCCGACDCK